MSLPLTLEPGVVGVDPEADAEVVVDVVAGEARPLEQDSSAPPMWREEESGRDA
jgi:hypothetical protein